MSDIKAVPSLRQPESVTGFRRVFVRDLVLPALIGVHLHEKDGRQRVRINLDMQVAEDGIAVSDQISDVVSYEEVVNDVRVLVAGGHINLVETLAEEVAALCLKDNRVHSVKVQIEKLEVFGDAESVGVEIERRNS